MTVEQQKKDVLNGRHMTAIFVAFFAVIMLVNFTMAGLATSGFSGTVVDNSYVASQKFNGWLAAADAQEKLGWKVSATRDEKGRLSIAAMKDGQPISGLIANAAISHPIRPIETEEVSLVRSDNGLLVSVSSLPNERRRLHLKLRQRDHQAYYEIELP